MCERQIRVTVWNEFRHEKTNATCKKIYPDGLHEAIANHLRTEQGMTVRTATLDEPEHGLTQEALDQTDVLTWWGHAAHSAVSDEIVERVHARVLQGMGLIALHSAHMSKIFRKLMGTGCALRWREADERVRMWVVKPAHPIVEGIGPYIELPNDEMYGEHFDIPDPDDLIFVNWCEGGEVFRGGCTWTRGLGKIFYFSAGHETYPMYHNPEILQVITNAVRWTAFSGNKTVLPYHGVQCEPIEKLSEKNYEREAIDHEAAAKG